VLFCVLAVGVSLAVLTVVGGYATLGVVTALPDLDRYGAEVSVLISEILASLVVAGMLLWLGWWRAAGFTPAHEWRDLRLLWLPVLIFVVFNVAVNLPAFDLSDPRRLALAVSGQMLTGFYEEALFRGVVLFTLLRVWWSRPGGVRRAVLVSSLVFGLSHGLGIAVDPVGTIVQILYAALIGVGFAALLLRTNALLPLAALHGTIDAISNALAAPDAGGGPPPAVHLVAVIGLPLLFALYGLYLVRGSRHVSALPRPEPDLGRGRR
jgi:membrane protease YdiL (CAAX protease family)